MHDRSKRIRQLEERLRTPPMEAAQRSLARMVAALGLEQVGVSGALRAWLVRYFGPTWLESPEFAKILTLAAPAAWAVRPEDAQQVFIGELAIFEWCCAPPPPDEDRLSTDRSLY